MKIGIITFHFPYNCGAGLQCAALQRVLEKKGHEVCVINYRPDYHDNLYRPLRNPLLSGKKGWQAAGSRANPIKKIVGFGKGAAFAMYSWKNYTQMKQADSLFKQFMADHLKLTRKYKSLGQLRRQPPPCDLYISGSDQLWNAALTGNDFDPAYFLKFGATDSGRITYAVSARFPEGVDATFEQELEELLSDLDAVSVRENKYLDLVARNAGGKPVCQSIDPTLLLDAEEYDEIMSNRPLEQQPYILTYCITSDTQKIVNNIAGKLSASTGLKLVNTLCYPKLTGSRTGICLCGPAQFLWYIRHAEYVVTDSFHGTVFSILNRKKFVTVPRGKADSRTAELLEKLGITGHITTRVETALEDVVKPIDYDAAHAALVQLREESLTYLDERIQHCADGKASVQK